MSNSKTEFYNIPIAYRKMENLHIVFGATTVKHLAMIPFVTGVLIVACYYLWHKPRHKEEEQTL